MLASYRDPEIPPLRVGLEATAILGARTGIGAMTKALVDRFACDPRLEATGLVVSWRGRSQVASALPTGISTRSLLFPARLAHRAWAHLRWPALRGFDVVHGPNFVVPPAPGAVEVVSVHDFSPWHHPQFVNPTARAYPGLVRRAVERGAHIHVDSAFVGAEAVDILGVPPDRVHLVHLGFDPQDQGEAVRGVELVGGPYVLALGTLEPRKDLPTLVAAMAQVWGGRHPREARLVVAGPDGWGSAAFAGAVEAHGAQDRVVRLGYVSDSDRADLLAGASCLAFPSLYEGFGLPPLEAMAAGTPVVTTTAGSLPEICGDAALQVEPGDPGALAGAIARVLDDPALASSLVDAGRDRIRAFSWDRAADQMVGLYQRLHARHHDRS